MSAVLCVLRNGLFPEEFVTEKDLQQYLSESNMDNNLSLHIQKKLDEALKINRK